MNTLTGTPAGRINDRTLRLAIIAFALLGLLVSLYLVYIKYNPASPFCVPGGGCDTVNSSRYSELAGIPVAIFGALAYLAIGALALLEPRLALAREWGPMAQFGLAFAGTLYSAYLTYIELAVIHAVCPYCVASAVFITLILIASILRLKRYL
jgi:uncharacterized membrane protein